MGQLHYDFQRAGLIKQSKGGPLSTFTLGTDRRKKVKEFRTDDKTKQALFFIKLDNNTSEITSDDSPERHRWDSKRCESLAPEVGRGDNKKEDEWNSRMKGKYMEIPWVS
ncbi:hypothetical protein Ddc_12333 [Ditylenchus destructor]|nr:hypothetical protein Ddc_12333 [Ditylenchus destructor]